MHITGTQTWLKIAVTVLIGFGFLIALAAHPALAGPTVLLTDLVFWPVDGAQSLAAPETRLFCAITGGIMVGWGTTLWLVASRIYGDEPSLVRTIFLASAGSWFVVDSIGSVAAGAPLNVLLNAGFLALFVIPVWRRTPPVAEATGR